MNIKGDAATTAAKVAAYGFPVTVEHMDALAKEVGEKTLFGRTGGAATLAVGMAQIFSKVVNGRWLDLWYHFAIMFEALFILTTLDAGTRVGRYILQDLLGGLWKPLGDTKNLGANALASGLMVCGWGWFLIQGVRDPLGGINSLWPLFGIANQMLAAIALCLATTVILKMQLGGESKIQNPNSKVGRPALALITLVPLCWLLAVTLTAGVEKIWHSDPRIGFLAQANSLTSKIAETKMAMEPFLLDHPKELSALVVQANQLFRLRFNQLLDAVIAGIFLALLTVIVLISLREWLLLLARKKVAELRETPPVWLPDYAVAEAKPLNFLSLLALGLALVKELSGEAHLERAQRQACECGTAHGEKSPAKIYVETTEERFKGVRRCC